MNNKKRLRIAMVASDVMRIPPVPPEKYVPQGFSGAPELMVSVITEELVRRGHQVTLFASGDSETAATLVSTSKTATSKTDNFAEHREHERILISKAYQMAKEGHFDIIHSHFDIRTAPYAPLVDTPTVSTLHSPIFEDTKKILEHFKTTQYYISISNAQRKPLSDLQYISTVYNGIDVDSIPFSEDKEDYLIFSGRMSEQKGVMQAIEIAKKSRQKLLLFGSYNPEERYWIEKVKPNLNQEDIIYKGFVPREELFNYIAKAKAFLFPVQWEEPFGLVVAEAMAAGTPVIASNKGSLPELVDEKTGFICNTVSEMVEALNQVGKLNPIDSRARAEEMFTIEKMVDGYEKAYTDILARNGK